MSSFEALVESCKLANWRWRWASAILAWADLYALRREPGDQMHAVELLHQSQAMFEEMGLPASWH